MGKIKVLHLTSTPEGIGGVERLLLDMAHHYDEDRFAVAHCNLFDDTDGAGPFPTELRATGLPFFEIPGRNWKDVPRMVGGLRNLIRRERIDVLHLHMVRATIVGGIATLPPCQVRVLVSKHYRYAALSGALPRMLDRAFTNRADAVAAVSRFVADDLLSHRTASSKMRIVHNGIDLEHFDRRSSEPATIPAIGHAPLLACFGNMHSHKGHEFALRAMPAILRSFPKALLLIIGEGEERCRLEDLIKQLRIEHAVLLVGYDSNVPAILAHIDLCIHPALDEAFGIVLLEAMAARKPIVASNVGGIPEIVEDGLTGLLVPPRDPDAIASAVCTLLEDPERAGRFGDAGRLRVEREFTVQKTVRSYERLYEDLMLGAVAR